ncbi:MAG: GvpL/GvpF family gas vesicle protein [Chloroflexi bacterium]|nr:GvpL/GvpF family gas vesicle protein [Chloroflexota bacterium]
MVANGCYVYAIVGRETPLPSGVAGLDGAPLVAVPWQDLAAVTSRVAPAAVRPTAERLLCHEAVVEAVRRDGRALPMRFGTVLPDPAAVAQALSLHHDTLRADRERLAGQVELGLVVLWKPEDCRGEAPPEQDSALRPSPATAGPGTCYLRSRLAEHRREAVVRSLAEEYARSLGGALHRYARESRSTTLPTPRLVLRAAYLLAPADIGAFREAFEALRRAHPRFRFLLSGPWPPYSFVTPPPLR